MLYLKRSNELIYVDFTKKDLYSFINSDYKDNVSKISIIINNILFGDFEWLSKLGAFLSTYGNNYSHVKVVLYTCCYRGNYMINVVLRKSISGLKYRLVGGTLDFVDDNNAEYHFIKKRYFLKCVKKSSDGNYFVQHIYERYFASNNCILYKLVQSKNIMINNAMVITLGSYCPKYYSLSTDYIQSLYDTSIYMMAIDNDEESIKPVVRYLRDLFIKSLKKKRDVFIPSVVIKRSIHKSKVDMKFYLEDDFIAKITQKPLGDIEKQDSK